MKSTITSLFSIGLLTLCVTSGVALARGELSRSSIDQERHQVGITVSGNLSCVLSEINTGDACQLKLQDPKTGATYQLADSNAAMRLFFSGKKSVSIEGRLDSGNVIRVSRVLPNES